MTAGPGRPIDHALTARILATAVDMAAERGVDRMTMRELAARAGVPRSTIYRRWASKSALLGHAVLDALEREVQAPDTGSLERDLVEWLSRQYRFLTSTAGGRLVLQLSTEGLTDERLRALVADIARQRRASHRAFLARAVAAGHLRADVDLERAIDLLAGAVMLRVISHQRVDRRVLAGVVQTALRGLGPP